MEDKAESGTVPWRESGLLMNYVLAFMMSYTS